jgi:hypothetical protein
VPAGAVICRPLQLYAKKIDTTTGEYLNFPQAFTRAGPHRGRAAAIELELKERPFAAAA